jgi:hypothetical protein
VTEERKGRVARVAHNGGESARELTHVPHGGLPQANASARELNAAHVDGRAQQLDQLRKIGALAPA